MRGLLLPVVAAVALISPITTLQAFDGCPSGSDSRWNVTWANTALNETDEQQCPGEGESRSIGIATRLCSMNGTWTEPNILECESHQFYTLRLKAEEFFSANRTTAQILAESGTLTVLLAAATETEGDRSLLPADLNTTNNILSTVISALENSSSNTTAPANDVIADVFNNVLEEKHVDAWMALQEVSPGSQVLLDNAERYGHHLARSLDDTNSSQVLSRKNIVISSNRIRAASVNTSEISFPEEEDLVNHSHQVRPARISIPGQFLLEEIPRIGYNGTIPVVHILFRNVCLLRTVDGDVTDKPASVVISSQVGDHRERNVVTSDVLLKNPISLHFDFPSVDGTHNFTCAYWNFSDPVGYGNWETDGVTTSVVNTEGNVTSVQCMSTHLTGFAVLVDVAGGLQGISEEEDKALQIISYIGCAISSVCLIISIVFFLLQGRKLFRALHLFVHLNLSISLLLGYLTFISGIETATGSIGGCAFVAALLHYFFLAAFCWMLCEGVMLHLMLVTVFSKLSRKWWFFLILGWVTPLLIVVTAVASRYQYYGVKYNETDTLIYCWISVDKGTIYAFVVPALAIILVNVIFLCSAVRSLWKSQQLHLNAKQSKTKAKMLILAKSTLKATVILLPLLGLTWVFGLLAIDSNTSVFAWLFTICNSSQGLLILFFHVIRSEMVWGKLGQWFTTLHDKTLGSILRSQKSELSSSMGTTSDLPNRGTLKTKKEANKDKNDYETTTLPKQSDTIEAAKFTSVAYSEQDHEISVCIDSPKEESIVENSSNSSSSDDCKATQPGMEKCGRSSVPRE